MNKDRTDHRAMDGAATARSPALIALDWGTSSLRAYLLGPDGAVLDSRSAPQGIMQVPGGDFAAVFEAVTGEWRHRWPELKSIAAGMIGSAQGWVEAPYLPCPAGPEELAGGLVPVPGGALLVVPGVAQYGEAPNVMRGEETQIAGALALNPALREGSLLVMPGTHSKWVSIEQGRIARFDTYMTGELFAVLRGHSILGRFARDVPKAAEDAAADAAFLRGVQAVREGGQVAPLLFSARALVLTGGLRPELSLDYLSGLLIGEELLCGLRGRREGVVLIGDPALCRRYREALALLGVSEVREIENAATAGLWRIAIQAGLAAGISEETV
ncbi:2-dehydro-3-deoxygalactonokinase [Roseomonas mucosa]|uniref:2-keto-3-deoxy-galactonokinase n=1 Tax=Roseomonas mucosa TaxID=207340 RepID=A0A379N328_9PROT|nr:MULTISPECIES: 2-dehydro-3-deoxygalactonokinase [Roseomonas]MCG7350180.1 2-dehydro-3-deoxygalactonokinase [Roseomonas mucosa]MCG7355041.1 2-dehydro-3-deoxygalactonokinase [Roseomonas mucosa]MDT8274621.1 2-dehydro-3-deoxygalactonokinase [Roseomonas mucosa]MDT8289719.1 2-dehydro-3-deoxygalactonokinase [Roseomonas mucosa]MDT8294596.1 2-dehydro-3-deoxygalactonokinase [Roseomonas mucosa]